jgi:predicted O-methyltransferase YrrM
MTNPKTSFKDLMSQISKEASAAKVVVEGKKKLNERYTFNQTWYDALLNTDLVLCTRDEAKDLALKPDEKRRIVEIGIYEGASSCFWSDFYMSHPESRLISIDPFTGSDEHHAKPENYPELAQIELTARGNIAKSDNAAKIEIVKGCSWDVFPELNRRFGGEPWIDVLYIDGAHDSASVARDTTLYVPMVKEGGIVIFDDYGHPDVRRGVDGALNAFASMEFAIYSGWQLICKVSKIANSPTS